MFASASRSNVSQRQAGAYKQVFAATGVHNASPHGLIAMLFDGLVGAIAEARGAMRSQNVPVKCNAIGRALRILDEGLRGGLDMEQGGALAAQLNGLYGYISVRLTLANLKNDEAALDECARLIEPVRSAWMQIGEQAPA
ncbi:MAG: flagellar export chaperone FliS [Pseudomonadota bacterium]|nr:flagellar export chaperone FliS [Pseudomonadota bacterium]